MCTAGLRPVEFFQYWRNVADDDVLKCIRMLTFLPLEQIEEMDTWKDAQLNTAKEILAYELTKLVHGEEEAEKARSAAKALFGAGNDAEMPVTTITEADLTDGKADIKVLLVKAGLCKSNSEARQNITQGGVSLNGEKVTDIYLLVSADELREGVLLKRGKKSFGKIVLE